jgi:crossover junction endodeoxyribonuclease RuvC
VRLAAIRDAVREVSLLHGATTGAIELAFVGTNARSALALGQARAAALIGMHEAGLGISEYTPAVVKQTVTGYGQGAKGQVALMVRLQLNLDREPGPADAADALAIALTHWARARLGLA